MMIVLKVTNSDLIGINLIGQRVANSTVEYSAFNRLVLGSNPRRPIRILNTNYLFEKNSSFKILIVLKYIKLMYFKARKY